MGSLSISSALSLSLTSRPSSAPAFTPASLSPTGWYDPSDITTLFQDSAGTVPVTASGDPVGRMNDKSGNDNHLTQATASARPIYTVAGAVKYLLFDGIDDVLVNPAAVFATQPNALWIGLEPLALSGNVFDGLAGRQALFGNLSFFSGAGTPSAGFTLNIGTQAVVGVQVDGASSYAREDGVNAAVMAASPGTSGLTGLNLGCFTPSSNHFNMKAHGFIVVDRLLTAGEMASLDTWMAAKQGRVL